MIFRASVRRKEADIDEAIFVTGHRLSRNIRVCILGLRNLVRCGLSVTLFPNIFICWPEKRNLWTY